MVIAELDNLRHKGFCVLEHFFNAELINTILQDFELIKDFNSPNKNYPILPAGKHISILDSINKIINPVCDEIKNININTNFTAPPVYFSIEKGINFGWHQDHESYFQSGDHTDYLNFYIPLFKPDTTLSNVSVINFERLFRLDPGSKFLQGFGATRLFPEHDKTVVKNDNDDSEYVIPFDIAEVAETPNLAVGDALIMRGDCIHKTQDTLTPRIAISIRRVNTNSIVKKELFDITSKAKQFVVDNNPKTYQRCINKFQTTDTLTLGELFDVSA